MIEGIKMTLNRSKGRSGNDVKQTMSTLQMWQLQMAALQRASKGSSAEDCESNEADTTNEALNAEGSLGTSVIYPHLP